MCPIPRIARGNLSSTDALEYKMKTPLTCDTGFGINGTITKEQTLECESDGKFSPFVACLGMFLTFVIIIRLFKMCNIIPTE